MVLIHTLCSLLSYVAFLVAFIIGLLFLMQERQLKRKTMGALFHRLPSLDLLDRINFLAISAGFGLLSIGLGCGLVGSRVILGRWWVADPKEVAALGLWACYLLLWIVRLRSTLRGHRVALLSVLGFTLVLFTFLGASWLLPTSHPYQSTLRRVSVS